MQIDKNPHSAIMPFMIREAMRGIPHRPFPSNLRNSEADRQLVAKLVGKTIAPRPVFETKAETQPTAHKPTLSREL
jgi:hypothetical protein